MVSGCTEALAMRRTKMTDWKTGIPPDGKPVLAVTVSDIAGSLRKRRQIVRAQYIHHKEIESYGSDDTEDADWYDEEGDVYWLKEGWYELVDYWEDYGYIIIDDPVIAWCELPELPEHLNA
jgi:hypothetical protein